MKTLLKDGGGIPNTLLYTLAIIAGISVANLYYNQPLLEMLRQDLHASTMEANHIALYTQIGYALGLLFIIPLADLFSRKRIILANFSVLVVSLLAIATAGNIYTVHVFSLLTGICSVIPQIFIPLTAQYSLPENKNRNVGIVLSSFCIRFRLIRMLLKTNRGFTFSIRQTDLRAKKSAHVFMLTS